MKIETKFDIVYRIVTNTKCNDFNEEPEYRRNWRSIFN